MWDLPYASNITNTLALLPTVSRNCARAVAATKHTNWMPPNADTIADAALQPMPMCSHAVAACPAATIPELPTKYASASCTAAT